MDLRSKLGLYKENCIKKASNNNAEVDMIKDSIPGIICSNEAGSFYCIESRYPSGSIHGGFRLAEARNIIGQSLSGLCSAPTPKPGGSHINADPVNDADFLTTDKLLFLDTETTGLSGGAGTVAFLVGIGYFEEDCYIVRQFFMRDYNEEAAMLLELNRVLSGYSALVTFNGKSFDWNLLQSRFIANRIRPALKEPFHIDLLYPSRKLWSLKLESCRLSSLEENILGETRIGDIPGSMIPAVYFKYLEDRIASDIKKVVRHNELDILSLVSLLQKIAGMLENPLSGNLCEHELLGLGRMYQKSGEEENGISCYELCAKSGNFAVKAAAVKHLTCIYKRNGNYHKALKHWESMLESTSGFYLFPMVQMAMYYEHKEKNAAKALEIIDNAIQLSLKNGLREGAGFSELRKRRDRLNRKVKKAEAVCLQKSL